MNTQKQISLELYKKFLDTKRPLEDSIVRKLEAELKTNYIYHSNAIEGNTLTLRETDVILEYGITVKGKSLQEHLEVKGQEYALNFLKEEVNYGTELSIKLIKDFHSLVLSGIDPLNAGVFKKYYNSIGHTTVQTVSPFQVEYELNQLIENYNKNTKENLIEKVAKFHADFEKIHPFSDGNGRTGRLIMNFELMKKGYPICIVRNEDRLEYYDSLELAQTKKDYSKIISFVATSLEHTFEFYFKHLSQDWKKELAEFQTIKTPFQKKRDKGIGR
ncbi:cell filamentation protein Fic [Fusobacterium necrophorum DAB]|uniref:Fic family protein n=1 Tax=Fusobacterium necrophorum TaxID=859 RepID=UPI0004615D74|nr:Fic family protein [Fusobacterium necrophorum]KDE69146.1 cell filamentation protein Fic [Fusobacterium necrophorum DAB]